MSGKAQLICGCIYGRTDRFAADVSVRIGRQGQVHVLELCLGRQEHSEDYPGSIRLTSAGCHVDACSQLEKLGLREVQTTDVT